MDTEYIKKEIENLLKNYAGNDFKIKIVTDTSFKTKWVNVDRKTIKKIIK